MNSISRSNALGNERVFRSLSYILVFVLMACVVMTMSILIRSTFPDWNSAIIAGAALFVIIDRLITYRQFKTLTVLSSEWVFAVGAQWIVILLVIRLLFSYANGIDSLREDLSLFARGYLERFFTPEYFISLLLALLVWYLTRLFLDLIDEIGFDQAAALQEESVPVQRDTAPAHQRMVNLVFSLGIVLVILTAMTRMNLRTILATSGGIPGVEFSRFSGAEAGALLYFISSLALLSLCRLMSLQTHWNHLRIPITSKNLARQWAKYSLFFLFILAVIISLLPSGDNVGFLSLVATIFGFILIVLLFITQLVVGLVLLVFSLPFLLFGKAPPFLNRSTPLPSPVLPSQPILPSAANETWALIRSTLLWGVLAAIIIFALIHFVRQHETIVPALRKSRVMSWLMLAWQWLYTTIGKTSGDFSRVLTDGWQNILPRREGKQVLSPASLINIRSLDPRRRVFFFYHALVRRGGEQEVKRKPSQTPSEYAAALEEALPASGEDIEAMTEAFIEARYSRHEVRPDDADRVKAAWGRLRRTWQSKAKEKKSTAK